MLTSHYMQDIEELCDRVIIIDHGKIFFDGPLNSIIDRFSGYKIISLTFQDAGERDFSALGEVIEQTPVSVQLKVPRAKVTETCRQLLEGCAVSDINVQEMPVEEVIRQLFGERTTLARRRGGRAIRPTQKLGVSGDKAPASAPARRPGLNSNAVTGISADLHFFAKRDALDVSGRHQAVERIGHVLDFHVGAILNLRAQHRLR